MEKIKFRGKRTDNDEWAYGSLIEWKCWIDNNWILHCAILDGLLRNREPRMNDFIEVDPATVGQFTGLKDKNGVEIYEGDVFEDARKWRAVVQWDEENARFLGVGSGFISYVGKVPSVKVIGNIHDNPELLGGAAK